MTDPRYQPDTYRTDFDINGLGVRYSALCVCGVDTTWTGRPSQPWPEPFCDCTHNVGAGGDGDRGNVGSLGTPPAPAHDEDAA